MAMLQRPGAASLHPPSPAPVAACGPSHHLAAPCAQQRARRRWAVGAHAAAARTRAAAATSALPPARCLHLALSRPAAPHTHLRRHVACAAGRGRPRKGAAPASKQQPADDEEDLDEDFLLGASAEDDEGEDEGEDGPDGDDDDDDLLDSFDDSDGAGLEDGEGELEDEGDEGEEEEGEEDAWEDEDDVGEEEEDDDEGAWDEAEDEAEAILRATAAESRAWDAAQGRAGGDEAAAAVVGTSGRGGRRTVEVNQTYEEAMREVAARTKSVNLPIVEVRTWGEGGGEDLAGGRPPSLAHAASAKAC